MKKKNILTILVTAFLMVGCGVPATPTIVKSPIPSMQPTLTATASPTVIQKPETSTVTPEPAVKTNGPYFEEVDGTRKLVFMDADGKGRKTMELPEAINNSYAITQPPDLDVRWISPDGHWSAFHTGFAGAYGEMPASAISDLTLNLLDLTTGEEQIVTPLLSKDFPDNFVEAAEKLNDPDITAQSLYDAFIHGITEAVAWSPDGMPKVNLPSNEASLDYASIPFGLGNQIFILMGDTSYFLSENLQLTPFDLKNAIISVSPNREYWVAVTGREAKTFSADNTPIKSSAIPLANSFVGDVIWGPDSSGLFLISGTNLLSMDVPAGDIKVVETDLINDSYNLAYAWISGQ